MNRSRYVLILLAVPLLFVAGSGVGAPDTPAKAPPKAEPDKPGLHLTIYNDNYALIKDRRELPQELKAGINLLHFRDVAATLDPTSVHFRSLTDPGAVVQEQNYEFDLVNSDKLLQKYVDRTITAHTKDGKSYEGTLLSFDARSLVLAADREKGPIYVVERGDNIKRIQFSTLPEGLLTRPTLVWEVESKKAGKHLIEVSYLAQQIRWRSDYNIVLNGDDTHADVAGWVTIENNTGTAFGDARVKLLAGEPRVDYAAFTWQFGPEYYKLVRAQKPSDRVGPDKSRSFGDYRMYNLPESTTVGNNQVKQVELITAAKVPVTKTYLYDGSKVNWVRSYFYVEPHWGLEQNKKVNVLIEIQNRAENNLGIALPKGKVRTYKKDTDGALEFIGEDMIAHTARDERLALYIGDAFDIVAERKQTEFQRVSDREINETFEIKLRNHKKEAVTVKVLEKLYRAPNATITNKSHDFEQLDAWTVVFPVKVEPDKEAVLVYRVNYKWDGRAIAPAVVPAP